MAQRIDDELLGTIGKVRSTRITRKNAERADRLTTKSKLLHKELTEEILGSFFTVYNELGYGFLEHVYGNALAFELATRGISVQREVLVEIRYEGQSVGTYRMDLVANGLVIIENKTGEAMAEAHRRQLFNYLRASGLPVGLLLHFGPRPSFKRFVWTGRSFQE